MLLASSLLLLLALRYLATLLSYRFKPQAIRVSNGAGMVTLPWAAPGINNYSALCNSVYNCSSDIPGTEDLIRNTLRQQGVTDIDILPLAPLDLNYKIDHWTGPFHFSSGTVLFFTGAGAVNGTSGDLSFYDGIVDLQP